MKIVKYLIAALLIISITKKVHVSPTKEHIISTDELEYYDAKSKTAQMSNGDTFVGIEEYNRSTTPPNIMNPSLKLFTQISTQNYTAPSKNFVGGVNPMTSLYGIPVVGAHFHLKLNKNTVGTYWPMNKIAQLNDGQTYVAIIEKQIGNYKKHGYYELGPIWTQFNAKELSELYNISTSDSNFQSRVKQIGIVTKNKQSFKLYGVLLNPPTDQTNFKQSSKAFSNIIEKESTVPGMDHFQKEMNDRAMHAYNALLQHTEQPQTHFANINNTAGIYTLPV
ncbi:hypothetical protein KBB68_03650 [Candidatus Babeliales bacterium]|nr:hypothetical protein [Candidatus Babeliales bacterium]